MLPGWAVSLVPVVTPRRHRIKLVTDDTGGSFSAAQNKS